ncbi:uncharacterized protein (TIGR01244 family) [Mesorhizobium sp. J18]|uniref:TIGR01244 family sulfur transferase n=1 Tax=Mesorhizobium sp. J18 TaxID=935263 RepID=UPI00119B4B93|nr:TIGR01244 family sulfur transferase [Mesorhizobium sp. J18]TWG89041.1 uncharacterized protein (TIGR01244 family) [Mesorhizobium sp. J18]
MQQVNEKLWIAPQLTGEDFADAGSKGIVGIVNNRPDDEEPGQLTAGESARIAAGLGLSYVHIPVVSGQITEEQVRAFRNALAGADGPVLAYCKSGTRSLSLWAIGEVLDGRMTIDELDELGACFGKDLAGAKKWLAARS